MDARYQAVSNTREEGEFSSRGEKLKLGAYRPGSKWLEPPPRKSIWKQWIALAIISAVVTIIIITVVLGVVLGMKKHNKNLSEDATGSSDSSTATASPNSSVQQTNPTDPSAFTKDPALHKAFYGLAYTPVGSQLPNCGNSLEAVIQDIQIMSQLTPRIRLYGADCNQTALVLEAIKQTKVDMTVYVGNFPIPTDNNAAYNRQRDILKSTIQTYGTDHIGGVTVGNEYILDYVQSININDVNNPSVDVAAQMLLANIQDMKNTLQSIGVSLPIGNADAGDFFRNDILSAVDYGMANVHPWFAFESIDAAAGWTADFFNDTNLAQASALPNQPKMYIAETGWPTKSSDAASASDGASDASVANLQTFLETFVCQANANGTGYFFFEFADESWKDVQFGGVEGWWGLFNEDRSLKSGISIPTCDAP